MTRKLSPARSRSNQSLFVRRLPWSRSVVVLGLVAASLAALSGCQRSLTLDEIRQRQAMGRYAETVEPLRKRLEKASGDPELLLLYGSALAHSGSPRVALWSLRKAAESEKWKIPAQIELATTHALAQNWSDAIAAAETVLELDPKNLPAHIVRGESRLGEGKDPARAIEDFDFVLEQDPRNVSALNSKASALLMSDKIDEAAEIIDELEDIVDATPADETSQAQLCAVQAVLRQERGALDEARKRFDECLERFPAYGFLVDAAIGYFDSQGDTARSDAILEKALELAPYSTSYRRTLALRKESQGDSARALEIFEAGLKTDDREQKIAAYTDLTNYHLDRDELPQAVDAYEHALELTTEKTALAVLTHADLLARAGRHEDARRVAEKLENPAFRSLIEARIALDENDPKRALSELDRVFPVWPNNAGARYYAARAAEQLGDFARAIEEYRQSIRSAADQTEAALRLARLYLAIGSLEEAWANAGYYLTAHGDDPEVARVMVAAAAKDDRVKFEKLLAKMRGSRMWPAAMAAQAELIARKDGPAKALAWIDQTRPTPDWTARLNGELLRERILLLHAAGRTKEADAAIGAALEAHPKDSGLLEAKGALLEAEGADAKAVEEQFRQAYDRDARNWLALDGLARVAERREDWAGAIEYYDRSTHAHPDSPDAARRAAALAQRTGASPEMVESRWLEILKEHPWDGETARSLARARLDRGVHDDRTLDYAERAVLFDRNPESEALLVKVHEARGEDERAQEVADAFAEGKPIPPRRQRKGNPGATTEKAPSPAATPPAPARPAAPSA